MQTLEPLPIGHLLVPLDGSRLAEATLPAATALAGRLGARVTLLHILERAAPATVHGERHLTSVGEAEAYLNGVASRFADTGTPVAIHAHPNPEGDVAASIAAHTDEIGADLILLCTHGRTGPRGWLSGSLAQRVVRHAGAPVLLIRPGAGDVAAAFAPHTVLVALDGTAGGEVALPAALALARACDARLHLVIAVATLATVRGDRAATARLTPVATSAALDLEEEEAAAYLARLGERLGTAGVPLQATVGRGDAARVVADLAARSDDAAVALATHARVGFEALWSGSVGTQVLARVHGPLLLAPAATPDQASEER